MIGDSQVGKSRLLHAAETNEYPEYMPTIKCEHSKINTMFDGTPYEIVVFETQGASDYDQLRPITYQQVNEQNQFIVFLLVFLIFS